MRGEDLCLRLGTSISTFLSQRLLIGSNIVSVPKDKVALTHSHQRDRHLYEEQESYHPVNIRGLVTMGSLEIIEVSGCILETRHGRLRRKTANGTDIVSALTHIQLSPR